MTRRFLIGLLALVACWGCIYEYESPDGCPDGPYYLSLLLQPQGDEASDAADTKATNNLDVLFRHGTVEEMLVASVDLYFYASDGSYQDHRHQGISDGQQTEGNSNPLESEVGSGVVGPLDYRPYRMLVMANLGSAQAAALENRSLSEVKDEIQSGAVWQSAAVDVTYQGVVYHLSPYIMSACSFLGVTGNEINAVAISERYLRHTEAEAAAEPIPIYLERMAARVTVMIKQQGNEAVPSFPLPAVTARDNVTARVEVTGWALNATNNESYVVKRIRPDWKNSFSWTWNSASRYRSYWAEDTNYSPDDNPAAYSFVSWNDLTNTLPLGQFGLNQENYFMGRAHCLENTSGVGNPATLYSRSTHLLVKARLRFGLSSGTDPDGYTTAGTVYRYRGVFYTATNLPVAPSDPEVTAFEDGEMYYKVPIEHLGGWDGTGAGYPVGTYGIVRNHCYEITLDGVFGVGTPRPADLAAPIVPTVTSSEKTVSLFTQVKTWTQFEQRFVFYDPRSGAVYYDVRTDGQKHEGDYNSNNGDWY